MRRTDSWTCQVARRGKRGLTLNGRMAGLQLWGASRRSWGRQAAGSPSSLRPWRCCCWRSSASAPAPPGTSPPWCTALRKRGCGASSRLSRALWSPCWAHSDCRCYPGRAPRVPPRELPGPPLAAAAAACASPGESDFIWTIGILPSCVNARTT